MKKSVLITGGSRGIGYSTAELFAKNEYNVVINYNNSEHAAKELEQRLNSQGYSAVAIKANLADPREVEQMFEKMFDIYKGIDILVNNAGIAQQKLFTELTLEDWNRMLEVNITGVFNCCKQALPHMINKKSGKIINVSSVWGITGASCEVHYSTSKAAIIGFTKALAKELGPSNIQVNCVAPGVIATQMNESLSPCDLEQIKDLTPLNRIGRPQDIAECILFLASDKADFITGQVISPNGGFVI